MKTVAAKILATIFVLPYQKVTSAFAGKVFRQIPKTISLVPLLVSSYLQLATHYMNFNADEVVHALVKAICVTVT